MSKGGGQGSFAQMQEPGLGMDMSGFGGGGPQPFTAMEQPRMDMVTPVGNSQNFSSGIGGKGGQLAPTPDYGFPGMDEFVSLDRNPSQIPPDITGFIPGGNNSSTLNNTVTGGEGLLYQLQPTDQPIASPQPQPRLGIGDPSNPMLQELRPLPQPGGFGAAMGRFNNLTTSQRERLGDLRVDDIFGSGSQRATNIQTQGPESLPRLEELLGSRRASEGSIPPPPVMTGGPVAPPPQFAPVLRSMPGAFQPGTVMDGGGAFGSGQGTRVPGGQNPIKGGGSRETAGIKPQPSDRVYAGGTPNFDERTGQYRQQPLMPRSYDDGRMGYRSPPQYGGYRPPSRPPIFGQPRSPFPYGQPRIPGRNTQFNMPFMPQSYGRMNPYAGQFGGYGVPSNVFGFGQPHYQPYAPPTYAPPPAYTPPPPVMQLPPGTGMPTFYGGGSQGPATIGGGIGGFGRYNLGLAGSQLY